jgi:hypothetical protein
MKRRVMACAAVLAVLPLAAQAQGTAVQVPPSWDHLAARAKQSVKVSLDRNLLALAAKFLSDDDADEAGARRLIAPLRGITVRSLEFARPGEYTDADVEPIRAQLVGWSRIVETADREQGESVDVFVRSDREQVTGLVVLAREPRQLTFVHIDGPIDPSQLSKLSGHFGIPRGIGKAHGRDPGTDATRTPVPSTVPPRTGGATE